MTTPEESAEFWKRSEPVTFGAHADRDASEQPKPATTGVFDTFIHPCLTCGTTVHITNGQTQAHECADLPTGDRLAYAWWQGYDTAKAVRPAVEWLGESVQAQQDDLRAILDALGISTHARPYSPHEVVQREVLPAIVTAVRDLAAVERERDELRATVARVEALADEWRDKRDQSIAAAEARRGLHDENDLRFHAHIMSKRLRELGAALEGGDDE